MNLKTPPTFRALPLVVLVLSVLSATPASAQYAGLLLYVPVNGRTSGMALAGTADNSDPSGIYFNPANAVGPERVYLVGSREDFGSDEDGLWLRRIDGGGSWKFHADSPWSFGARASFERFRSEVFLTMSHSMCCSLRWVPASSRAIDSSSGLVLLSSG